MEWTSWNREYKRRFDSRSEESKRLYCEVYHNDMQAYEWLCDSMYGYYKERNTSLKNIDRQREKNPNWYSGNDLFGILTLGIPMQTLILQY